MVELAHYRAVNLARRLTSQNENDMLGFVGYEDDGERTNYTKDMCEDLAKRMMHVKNLPQQCMKYGDVVKTVDSNDRDLAHPTSWMS